MEDRVNCMKCKHYYVTWDTSFPKGCRIYGFKTARIPSALVYESTGMKCTSYEEKMSKPETQNNR